MQTMQTIQTLKTQTPFGDIILGSYQNKLCLSTWLSDNTSNEIQNSIKNKYKINYNEKNSLITIKAREQLLEYFEGTREKFTIPLLKLGTLFQKKVWTSLLKIHYGTTITYLQQAYSMNSPGSVRATANANGANPLVIFIPCHRVIGSMGQLTGYSGGITIKKKLLLLETSYKQPNIQNI